MERQEPFFPLTVILPAILLYKFLQRKQKTQQSLSGFIHHTATESGANCDVSH